MARTQTVITFLLVLAVAALGTAYFLRDQHPEMRTVLDADNFVEVTQTVARNDGDTPTGRAYLATVADAPVGTAPVDPTTGRAAQSYTALYGKTPEQIGRMRAGLPVPTPPPTPEPTQTPVTMENVSSFAHDELQYQLSKVLEPKITAQDFSNNAWHLRLDLTNITKQTVVSASGRIAFFSNTPDMRDSQFSNSHLHLAPGEAVAVEVSIPGNSNSKVDFASFYGDTFKFEDGTSLPVALTSPAPARQ